MAIPLAVVVAILAALLLPRAFRTPLLDRLPPPPGRPATSRLTGMPDPQADPTGFAGALAARLNAFWGNEFPAIGRPYRAPTLDRFADATSLPCFPLMDFNDGPPYYCFLNDTVYVPQQYVSDLAGSPGVSGTVAVAYSLAHEFAHHVQHLSGLGATVEDSEAKPGAAARRALVSYELQADCLAGLFLRTVLAPGSVDQTALAAAQTAAIEIHGPEGGASLDTHGTLEQRHRALWAGFQTGRGVTCQAL